MAGFVEDKLMMRMFLLLRSKSKKLNDGEGLLSDEVVFRKEVTRNTKCGNSKHLFKWH